ICEAGSIPAWRTVATAALGSALAVTRDGPAARRHLTAAAAAITRTGFPGWHSTTGANVLDGLARAGLLTTARRYGRRALESAEARRHLRAAILELRAMGMTAWLTDAAAALRY